MTEEEAGKEAMARFTERAERALAAAKRDYQAEDLELAMSRVYYACFYALSAALLNRKMTFSKHSGVRAALHQQLVKKGEVDAEFGKFYDEVFDARQEADYVMGAAFDAQTVSDRIAGAERFIATMRRVANSARPGPSRE